MDELTAKNLMKRIRFSIKKYGFGEYADDLVQDVLVHFISRPKTGQSVDQAVIDIIRKRFSRGTGISAKLSIQHIKATMGLEKSVAKIASGLPLPDVQLETHEFLNHFKGKNRVIAILYSWGFTMKEIGYCLGVGESSVSQSIKKLKDLDLMVVRNTQ